MTKRRRSRREFIATVYGSDLADVEDYQPGKTTLPLFTAGEDVVAACRAGEHNKLPPEDWTQTPVEYPTDWGYTLWKRSME